MLLTSEKTLTCLSGEWYFASAMLPLSSRREAFRNLACFILASPLLADNHKPELTDSTKLANVFDFHKLAKQLLDPLAIDYMEEGGKDEISLMENRLAFRRMILRPRFLTDVHNIDLSTEFLGYQMETPIFICPAGGKNCFYRNGEEEVARGAALQNMMYISNGGAEDYIATGNGPKHWWQYTTGGRFRTTNTMLDFVERLEDTDCTGICFTVDNMLVSHRERSVHNGLVRNWCNLGNIPRDESGELIYEDGARIWNTGEYPSRPFPTPTWDTVKQLREMTDLKIMLKGLMIAEDVEKAVEVGVDTVVVSNHGARQLDHTGSTIEALPECVQAASEKIPVLVDGGFRRGTDILKALAIGATAVGVARPYLWGLACFGRDGVSRVIDLLKTELALDMGMSGVARIDEIDSSLVRWRSWSYEGDLR